MFTRLAVTPSAAQRREAVSAALFAAGAEGLIEEGVALVAVFGNHGDARAAERAARAVDAAADTDCVDFDPGDYMETWRRGVGAHVVGRLVIAPPWLAAEHDAGSTIVIEPAMGFGTGEHASTRATLLVLQGVVTPGDVVIDAGCGSGVLSIAAARLGASRVVAVEMDPMAIGNAEENIERNGVARCVRVVEGDATVLLPLLAPVRVVVANIISTVLVNLLPVFDRALSVGGDLVVGGILQSERDEFVERSRAAAWRVHREHADGDWWSAQLRRSSE